MTYRYELERGTWITSRAGRAAGARRRGEKLLVRAYKHDRTRSGMNEQATAEIVTRSWVYRMIYREDGVANQLGWAMFICAWSAMVALFCGVGLVLGAVLYGVRWLLVPQLGRMQKRWVVMLCVLFLSTMGVFLYRAHLEPLIVVACIYGSIQITTALLYYIWRVHAYGWKAVKSTATGHDRLGLAKKKKTPAQDEFSLSHPLTRDESARDDEPTLVLLEPATDDGLNPVDDEEIKISRS